MQIKKRSTLFHVSKHQWQILLLTLLPAIILLVGLTVLFSVSLDQILNTVVKEDAAKSILIIKYISLTFFLFIWGFLIVTVMLAFLVSNNVVGSFERLIGELDEIIKGGKKRTLVARKNDYLTNDLLLRINKILEQLPVNAGDKK